MKINWKELSKTKGYKSLKACYIKDAIEASIQKNPMRKKKELYKHFQWVINRAKHYAHFINVPIENVLNEWTSECTYWWLNCYTNKHKFNKNKLKPNGLNHIKKNKFGNKRYMRKRILRAIHFYQMKKSTKVKPRLDMDHKRTLAYHRNLNLK